MRALWQEEYVLTLHYFHFFFNDTATTEIYTLSLHDALPIVGSSTAEPSASIDSRPPPMPRSTPRLPSTTGAGSAPLYPAATDEPLVNALSGLGRATLVAFTRAEKAMWPTPPSVPAVPRTGLPPEITIPASGLKAFIASTAGLQAFSASVVVAALHWGSPCAASGGTARPSRSAHNEKRRIGPPESD